MANVGTKLLIFGTFLLLKAASNVGQKLVTSKANANSLVFVQALWRHGDRTPSTLIPSDHKNNISSWKSGLGELTKKGMAQQYRLGKYLRERYGGFLAREYSPFEVYYRSSDYNRTLASAQANAAGLFAPEDEELFMKELKWRPIPVHTLPKHTDRILFDAIDCPTADAEEGRLYAGQEVKDIERANEGLLRYLGEKSGLGNIPLPLRDVWDIFDPLNSEYNHLDEHTLPDWVNESIRQEIWEIYNISCHYLYGSELLTRLRGGPLFVEILNRMKAVAAKVNDPREKLYAYSAHDTSVAGILSAFGAQPKVFPHYATLVLVELHRDQEQNHFVKLLYKNETDGTNLWDLEIPGCPSPCSLARLEEARAGVIPLNWEEECGLYSWYEFNARAYYFMICALLVVCIALLIEVIVLSVRLQNTRDAANYRHDSVEDGASQKFLLTVDDEEEFS